MDEDWTQTNGGQWNRTNQLALDTELALDLGLNDDEESSRLELSLAGSEAAAGAAFQEDPEVRSIMIDNDKLVASLANSVASAVRQTEAAGPTNSGFGGEQMVSGHNPARRLSAGPQASSPSSRASPGDASLSDDDPNKQQQQDYEMNLLVNLVRRTMIEEDNYSISDMELMELRNQSDQPTTDHHHHQRQRQRQYSNGRSSSGGSGIGSDDEINEPFAIPPSSPIGLDQSSKKPTKRSGHRKRRRANNNRLGADGIVEHSMGGGSGSNSLALPRPPATKAASALDDECEPESGSFRSCFEMPECESGGRCFVEVNWISDRNSDMARLEGRARCRCPIGRGGQLCQKPLQRSTPRFMGHSYLALPMITEPSITSLRLLFRPETRPGSASRPEQSSLLLQSQRFLLILDDSQRVELRYSTSTRANRGLDSVNSTSGREWPKWKTTRVMGSRDAVEGQWNELIVTDVLSDRQLETGADDDRIILVAPERIHLDHKQMAQELFVGGNPELARLSEQTAPLATHKSHAHHHRREQQQSATLGDRSMIGGFMGCIRELSINGRQYKFRSDLEGDALDGFDVVECC